MSARAGSLALLAGFALAGGLPAQMRTMTATRELRGESDMTIHVQYGAGRFHLGPGDRAELYHIRMRYDENKFEPVREYDASKRELRLGVRSHKAADSGWHFRARNRRREEPSQFDLALSPGIPLTLDLEMGAVVADADLGGLSIRRATLKTGASESHFRFAQPNPVACEQLTLEAGAAEFHAEQIGNANCGRLVFNGGVGDVTLDFGGAWRRSMAADVSVGIGSLKLRLPRDVGIVVHLNRFLASFDAAGFEKRGSNYYSGNFASARYRLTLNVNASLGGVDVTWLN